MKWADMLWMTGRDENGECGHCALEAQHGGPCAYIHGECEGRGCPGCEQGLIFDPDPLEEDA
jgi:hypothetical protein